MSEVEVQHVDSDTRREVFPEKPEKWSPSLARRLAVEAGIGILRENHWAVIDYLRRYYEKNKTLPVMELVCRDLEFREGCIVALFRKPEVVWRLAGLPAPGDDARAYTKTPEIPS